MDEITSNPEIEEVDDPKLRAAIHDFFRTWTKGQFDDDDLKRFVDKTVTEGPVPLRKLFLLFHANQGRYPTFDEVMSRGWTGNARNI